MASSEYLPKTALGFSLASPAHSQPALLVQWQKEAGSSVSFVLGEMGSAAQEAGRDT